MDQGSELWRDTDLKAVIADCGYTIEPTGSDAPFQNGMVEHLNGTFRVMVRSLLYSSSLHPKFWSYALRHAAYLKNLLVHSATGKTPYEMWHGVKPDLSHLRVFGSLVVA